MGMTTNTTEEADHRLIEAIRGGDIERYGELVARYERQVYGVAWSRLGDAGMAEEASQLAFIHAFRHLGLLRDANRFGAWLTRIARGVAINLGLRQRRELRKRQLWSLECVESDAVSPAPAIEKTAAPDHLREALADLPPRHRECLLLFYLEGRSVTECASRVGISEVAFKVRLHRARRALRANLENRLEEALQELKPRRSLVPGVMALLPAKAASLDPTGAGPGLLAGSAAMAAKLLPAPLMVLVLPLLSVLAAVGVVGWTLREERRNYVGPDDFRSRLHRRSTLRGLLLAVGVVLLVYMVLPYLTALRLTDVLAILLIPVFLVQWRQSNINRNPAFLANAIASAILLGGLLLNSWSLVPSWVLAASQVIFMLILAWAAQHLPRRFDYNLFLRHAKRMLPENAATIAPTPLCHTEAMRFGRLLGTSWLVVDYRRVADGVRFRLTPVDASPLTLAFPFIWRHASVITVRTSGAIEAKLGANDEASIAKLSGHVVGKDREVEADVAAAVAGSLSAYQRGDAAAALQWLGETPDKTVFKVAPARAQFVRSYRWLLIAGAVVILAVGWRSCLQRWDRTHDGQRSELAGERL